MVMQVQEQRHYSIEEYFESEISAEERHAYLDGEIVLMPGGTPNHNQLAGNLYAALNFVLKRQPYRVYITDQRLWIPSMRIYTYPDVMVMAEPIRLCGRSPRYIDQSAVGYRNSFQIYPQLRQRREVCRLSDDSQLSGVCAN